MLTDMNRIINNTTKQNNDSMSLNNSQILLIKYGRSKARNGSKMTKTRFGTDILDSHICSHAAI